MKSSAKEDDKEERTKTSEAAKGKTAKSLKPTDVQDDGDEEHGQGDER